MGKVLGGVFATLLIVVIVFLVLFKMGIIGIGGKGFGKGGSENDSAISSEMKSEEIEKKESVTIVVKQDEYYIDNQQVTLTQLKEKVTDKSVSEVIIENNYASSKTWDELKNSLDDWGITPVEQ
ncbi:MAG: hypothetical protein E7271_03850 [Lachnospiraceae bacterium]|jgi:hypothetical protein|nr:hypothetical protein [Lachnospiraceae bacterium]